MIGTRRSDRPMNALDIACQRIVEDGGGIYNCRWIVGNTAYVVFTSPTYKSTLALKEIELTSDRVVKHIAESDARFEAILAPDEADSHMIDELRAVLMRQASQAEHASMIEKLLGTNERLSVKEVVKIAVTRVWEPTGGQLRHWVNRVKESVSRRD